MPKVNEVWEANSGRLVLVVRMPNQKDLGFIWYDEIDKDFSVSELRDQLRTKTELTPGDWGIIINEQMNGVVVFNEENAKLELSHTN